MASSNLAVRTREMTPDMKTRIEKNRIFICERHFKAECVLTGKLNCCSLLFVSCSFSYINLAYTRHIFVHEYSIIYSLKWALTELYLDISDRIVPTENLPENSHEARKRERRVLVRKSDTPVVHKPSTSPESEPQYSDIEDFTRQLKKKNVQPCK